MPRGRNLEKYEDFALLLVNTDLTTQKMSVILDIGPSTLSRWQNSAEHKAKVSELADKKVSELADKSDKEVFDTKLKYAIRLLFKDASLRQIKVLCRIFENRNSPNDMVIEFYEMIASTARTCDLDLLKFFNKLADRAGKIQ